MIQVFTHTEPGGHEENEDALMVLPHPRDEKSYLCIVADGQGGQPGGAEAAREACRVCAHIASAFDPPKLFLPGTWSDLLHSVDHSSAGFTTLVAFCIGRRYICGASCGDSAAILIDRQTPGVILTSHQSKNPPVGSGGASFAVFGRKLESPWAVLAMSDGVWKYAGLDRILKIDTQQTGQEMIDSLRRHAQLPGSGQLQDDFTLVIVLDSIT